VLPGCWCWSIIHFAQETAGRPACRTCASRSTSIRRRMTFYCRSLDRDLYADVTDKIFVRDITHFGTVPAQCRADAVRVGKRRALCCAIKARELRLNWRFHANWVILAVDVDVSCQEGVTAQSCGDISYTSSDEDQRP